ncbi:hypothetical protein BOTCAL_0143g00150 [Botryotinia calthae]|uniref:Uncharacterized protein n=1 Tax=Botryotinia calthae TaxID=38488 RepID=A0A4Y8D2U3_9HELO|nr:hypothetical protein BOTCAL_0143g00150 [Botryotinia calthae]
MPSLFGIVIPKSLMLLFAYTILLAPLLGFTSAEVTHNPAALAVDQLVPQAAQIKVDNFTQAINSLIHQQHRHHHNEDRHNHAFNISARNDPALYAARVVKGRQLYCTMMDSLGLTTQKNGGVSQEALIYDPGNLYTEGFRTYVLKADDEHGPVFGEALDEPLNFLGSDVWEADEPMPVLVREAHTAKGFSQIDTLDPELWHDSSRLVEPTGAEWETLINCDPGLLVADRNVSPASLGFNKNANDVPRIWSWSDAVFLYYKRVCGASAVKNLEWVIRAGIVNIDTNTMVKMTLRASGHGTIPLWGDRITLHPTDDPFFAILGSKNGAGVGFLLNTHKDIITGLGVRKVNSITIWTYGDEALDVSSTTTDDFPDHTLCLLFEIGPVTSPNQIPPPTV